MEGQANRGGGDAVARRPDGVEGAALWCGNQGLEETGVEARARAGPTMWRAQRCGGGAEDWRRRRTEGSRFRR